jgi:FG-GAP repeat
VYVFTESSGDFTEQARLRANEAAVNFATFGWTVALSGDTALIGTDSTQALPDDRKSGVAYQFTRSANTWTQQARLTPADGGLYDGFGVAVSLSVNSAMIGAPAQNSTLTNARDAGAVYLRMRQFQVNASATTGGTITPSIAMVVAGDRHTVSMIANAGYVLSNIGGCGGVWNGSATFQTAPIQANCTIEAVFASVSPIIFANGFEN